jgi:mRNA interferase RelE/StbE
MAWTIELAPDADRQLRKIDRQVATRIRLSALENPRQLGEPLHGPDMSKFWKYRVGDWRVIAEIKDGVAIILVIKIGNRREVYRAK